MPRPDDDTRYHHMLEGAEKAVLFMAGRSRADLDSDDMLAFAVRKAIEVIGEAAAGISAEGRKECATLHWPSIIGMRNRLVHGYFEIDHDRVWDTVKSDLPELIAILRTRAERRAEDSSRGG